MMLKNENFDIYEIIKDNELQLLNLTGSELSWFCPVLYSMTFCLHVVLMRAECVCSPNTLYIHIYVCVCVCHHVYSQSVVCPQWDSRMAHVFGSSWMVLLLVSITVVLLQSQAVRQHSTRTSDIIIGLSVKPLELWSVYIHVKWTSTQKHHRCINMDSEVQRVHILCGWSDLIWSDLIWSGLSSVFDPRSKGTDVGLGCESVLDDGMNRARMNRARMNRVTTQYQKGQT